MAHQHPIDVNISLKKRLSPNGVLTLVLSLITLSWLLFLFYKTLTDLPGILQFDLSDFSDILIGAGYLLMQLFSISTLYYFRQE